MRPHTHIHFPEWLHVDSGSTKVRLDNLQTCSLTLAVEFIDIQKICELVGHQFHDGFTIYFLKHVVGVVCAHDACFVAQTVD